MKQAYGRIRDALTVDQKINVLLIIVGIVTAGTLILAALIYPQVTSSSAGIDAQNRSDSIKGCIDSYRSEIDDAEVKLLQAQAHSDELIRQGFAAVALGDRERLREVAQQASGASEEVADALVGLDIATDRSSTAVVRSQEDTDAFLKRCRLEGRINHSGD